LQRYYLDNQAVLDPIDVWLYGTALPLVFLFTVFTTTTITIFKLRQATNWRQATAKGGKTGGGDQDEVRL
jgi:hypothetical protein